jgi:hypothetical protein
MKFSIMQTTEARIQLRMAIERLHLIEAGDFSEKQHKAVIANLSDGMAHLGFELAPIAGCSEGGRL